MNQAPPTPPPPAATPYGWQPPPEQPGPAPGVQFAPHAERLVAYIVDSLIVSAIMFLGFFVVIFAGIVPAARGGNLESTGLIFFVLLIAALVIGLGYFPFFWARGGQTPGMRLFGLYVVRDRDGGPVGAGAAILRLIGFWIDAIAFYLGYIWVFIDARRRAWHDLIAGTVVVKR